METECDSSDPEEFLQPSFCIDTKALKNFVPTDTPSNGHEYLYSVMNEAKNCPQTIVAKIELVKFKGQQTVYFANESLPKVDGDLLPTDQWKTNQLENFTCIHQKMSTIKPSISKNDKVDELESSSDWWTYIYNDEGKAKQLPLISTVGSLDQVNLVALLNHHVKWLSKGKLELNFDVASWLYALLACLDLPLSPETCDTIRSLARYSGTLRTTITSRCEEESVRLDSLNLLICLIGLFFGQADLAD